MTEAELLKALDEAFAKVDYPQQLVGRTVPKEAERWAEEHGVEVRRSLSAPPGKLYLIGAVPVPWGRPGEAGA